MSTPKRTVAALLLAAAALYACGNDANYLNPIDFAFGLVDEDDGGAARGAPAVASLSPDAAPGGAEVTAAGKNFGAKPGKVTAGGVEAGIKTWKTASVTFAVPLDVAAGVQPVVVRAGARESKPVPLVIIPAVTALAPASGVAGDTVAVSGANFGPQQGDGKLFLGQAELAAKSWSARKIEFVLPDVLRGGTGDVTVQVGGQVSAGKGFTLVPGIAAASPLSGTPGTLVTITGKSFGAAQGDGRVRFGSAAGTIVTWSAKKLTVRVPSAAAAGPVQITVVLDGVASNGVPFTVLPGVAPAPAIASVAPGEGFAGTSVTVAGTNFGAAQGASTLRIGGAAVSPLVWSASSVQFVAPASVTAGTAAVVITTGGGASNAVPFVLRPSLISLVPAAGPAGTALTIRGSNFGAVPVTGAVLAGGRSAAITAWNNAEIQATLPAGLPAGTAAVTLTLGGQASNAIPFTVVPPSRPVLTAVTPASAMAGTVIDVQGANLGAVQGASIVYVGGTAATISAWGPGGFTLTVPGALATGPRAILAVVDGYASNVLSFAVTSPTAPVLTAVLPAAGPVGTQFTVTGTGLGATQGSGQLSLGAAVATVVSWSDTGIVAAVPASAAAGAYAITVTAGGETSNALPFAVTPVLASLSPVSGATGALITLSGSGFGSVPQRVTVGGGDAVIAGWSALAVTAVVPGALAAGAYPVQVFVNGQATRSRAFTVTGQAAPVITAVLPPVGAGGARVSVAGSGFGAAQGGSRVSVGALPAPVVSWRDDLVQFDVPVTFPPGPAALVVTAGGLASNALTFTVAPSLTGARPTGGPAGSLVTLDGANLGASPGTLEIGGAAVLPVAWSNAAVAFHVPVGLTPGEVPVLAVANGKQTNAVAFTITGPDAPVIATLNPGVGAAGTLITIAGAGFGAAQGGSMLTFGGAAITAATWSGVGLTFAVPVTATGTYDVFVTVGGQASNRAAFTVTAPAAPSIISLSPNAGAAGAWLAITGAGFGQAQGGSTLEIGGVEVTPLSWSETLVTAAVPVSLASGAHAVVVTVGGLASNSATFTVRNAQLTGVTPLVGAAGAAVTVSGSGLGAAQGGSRLTIGGADATITSWSDTAVDAVVPMTLGAGDQSVVAWIGGQPSNALTFTVTSAPPPALTGLSLGLVSAGMAVTVSGTGFGAVQGGGAVNWGGVALPVVQWSNASVTVRIPAGVAPGTGTLTLTAGGQLSNGLQLTVAPSIYALTPPAAYTGGAVTVSGANFGALQGSGELRVGGTAVTVTGWSMAAATFSVPALVPGDYSITVVAGGQPSNAVALTLLAPAAPQLTALSPAAGQPGTPVVITGSGFGDAQGGSTLSVGGVAVTPSAWSATSIAFPVPALPAGAHLVVVTVGGVSGNAVAFTITAPAAPELESVSPVGGAAGSTITIAGVSLGAYQGASTLTLDGAPVTVLAWNDTSITARIPAGATAGTASLVVTAGGFASNALAFAVRPSLAAVTPAAGPTGASIVLTGDGFGAAQGASQVFIGGGAATVTGWSAAAVTAVVPGGIAPGAVMVSLTVNGQPSNGVVYLVTATAAPVVTGVSPLVGSSGASVIVSGAGFGSVQGASTLTLGGTPIQVSSWSDALIAFSITAGTAPGNPVLVVTVAGQASNGLVFTIEPVITAVDPSGGPAGTRVTLAGTNFGGAGSLRIAGTQVPPAGWSATSVAFDIPLGLAAGTHPVVITAGGQASNTVYVTVTSVGAPALASLSPTNGLAGVLVTASGLNLGATQGASTVNVGPATALVAAWSASSVAFTAPALSPGSYLVSLTVGGQATNAMAFTITAPASPVIASLSPAAGKAGTQVTVAGSDFGAAQGAGVLRFNGVSVTPTSWSATSIAFEVPVGTTAGAKSVQVTAGGMDSNTVAFTVRTAALTSLAPAAGPAGTTVTAYGSDLGAVQGAGVLSVGGLDVAPDAWFDTAVTFTVPSTLGPGTQPVWATVDGQASNALDFTITAVAPPVIESASPAAGSGGAVITLAGQRFGAVQGASTVTLGGVTVPVETWSNALISVRVPAALAAGAKSFAVTAGGQASNTLAFTVTPTLVSLTPGVGPGGTTVTLTGTNFGAAQGASRVSFAGYAVAVSEWWPGAITFGVPATAAAGTAAVAVSVGDQPSNALDFTVTAPGVPAITSITPPSGPAGSALVIAGTDFGDLPVGSSLTIGGVVVTPTAWSSGSIWADVPGSLSPGAHDVIVTVSAQPSNTATFTVTVPNAPSIASLTPNQGPAGAQVTLSGVRFGAAQGASALSFGGIAVTALAWSDTTIVANVPASLAPGLQPVVVTVDGAAGNAVDFAVRPQLQSAAPSGAPPGVAVTLTGAGFGAVRGASSVSFGGAAAEVISWSDTSLAVTVPSGATVGSVSLVVTINGQPSNALAFSVLSPSAPYITGVNPVSGPTGTAVTLTGLRFGAAQGASTLSFDGQAAVATAWSDTAVSFEVPAGVAVGPRGVVLRVGGEDSNAASFTVVPAITGVSPAAGAEGASVTLSGTSFGATAGGGALALDGAPLTPSGWSAGAISFVLPAGLAAGTHTLALSVGGYPANGVTVGVLAVLSAVSPASVTVGTTLTLTGSGFGSAQGASTLTVGGVAATVTSWTAGQIVCTVPELAGGVHDVVLSVAGQSRATQLSVTPWLYARTPATGSSGTAITLTGSGFGAVQGASEVRLGGLVLPVLAWSPGAVTAQVSSAVTAGTQSLRVDAGGQGSNALSFTVSPTLAAPSPASASGGASITLSGTGFGATQGGAAVTIAGVAAPVVAWSSTSIVITLPNAVTGGTQTVAVNVDGETAAQPLTVVPAITLLTPAAGGAGTLVTLSGTNLGASQGSSRVVVGGATAAISAWSAAAVTFAVPATAVPGSSGAVVIVGGQASAPAAFNVSPSLVSIAPLSGAGGTSVTLAGANLGVSGTLAAGGIAAVVIDWYPGVITATVPDAVTAGTHSWVATAGGVPSNALSFTVLPAVSGVAPGSGSGGTAVSLAGTNFGASQGASVVSLAGTALVPASWSSTAIGFAVPDTAPPGVQTVAVTVGGQTAASTFTVLPAIGAVSPSPATGGTSVTVTGTNLGASGSLTVAGVSVATSAWSDTAVSFVMPAALTAQTGAPIVASAGGYTASGISLDIAPSIYALGATSGAVSSSLTITGANFGAAVDGGQVKFGSTQAAITGWTNTSVVAVVPAALASGWYDVTVVKGGQTSNARAFWAVGTGFRIAGAETLDCDPVDGMLDHYRITYNENADDATFEGYLPHAEGLDTARWSVAGTSGVRLHHGAALPGICGVDAVNDPVHYLKFDAGSVPDTGNRPELTANAALVTALAPPASRTLFGSGTFGSAEVAEADKAGPFVYYARAYEGGAPESNAGPGDRLELRYSEGTAAPALAGADLDGVFTLGNGHQFGAPADVTAAVWSATSVPNDTLTVHFGSLNPTVAVGDTLAAAGTDVPDPAGNAPATTVTTPAVIAGSFEPGPVGPTVVSAAYHDLDSDGHIDHAHVVFSAQVDDATFPGYAANALGAVTSLWQVAGYSNVRLDTRTAVTGDAEGNAVLWLAFDERGGYDTEATPDLTATADVTQLRDVANACYFNASNVGTPCTDWTKAVLTSSQAAESDMAPPLLVRATAKPGSDRLFLAFSENVWRAPSRPACGAGGELQPGSFTYQDLNTAGASAVQYMDADSCAATDALAVARTNNVFTTADLGVDSVSAANGSSIYDGAGNAMAGGVPTVILSVQAPYVLAASSFKAGAKYYLRVVFSEAMNAADALTAANYAIQEDTATACTDLAAAPVAVLQVAPNVFDLETAAQCGNTTTPKTYYRITISNVRDADESAPIGTPNLATTLGTDAADTTAPRLLLAVSETPYTAQLIFSEPMQQGDVQGSAECLSSYTVGVTCTADADGNVAGTQLKYTLTPGLGVIAGVERTANPSVYVLTHQTSQRGLFYNLAAYATAGAGVTAIPKDSAGNSLLGAPNNQATFQGLGAGVFGIDDGPLFDDPFGDGTTANFAFTYANRVYTGPNNTNSGAFRFEADGANPVAVSFQGPAAGACPYASSFGVSSSTSCLTGWGPNSETGLVGFNAGIATLGSPYEILMVGTIKNGISSVYFTQDVDTQLDWTQCSLGSYTGGGNTKSLQNTYTFADNIYGGISSDHAQQAPILVRIPLTGPTAGKLGCNAGVDLDLRNLTNLGKLGGNPAVNPAAVGIDAMLMVPGSAGTINAGTDTFYVANNGGVAKSNGTPTVTASFAGVMAQTFFANYDSAKAGDNVTLVIDSLLKLSPGRKGVPRLLVYKDTLFMARNVALGQTAANQVASAGGELWKCSTGCTSSANWTRVFTSSSAGSGAGIEITSNTAVSLLEVSGRYLYVGFDNMADGARVYRTDVVPGGPGSFTEIGRKSTAACANHSGDSGALGGLCYAYQFLSSTSIAKDAYNYLYVTVGCTLATASGDGQTCDMSAGAGVTLSPMKVLVQRDN